MAGDADRGERDQPTWLAGNVGGAWRIGGTVHRPTGPWTPAVHAFLDFLAPRLERIPGVLGFDEQGREVLTFLPGRVVDIDTELLTSGQIDSLVSWTRRFHEVVAGFDHPGPWRYPHVPQASLIGHNDIAPYLGIRPPRSASGAFARRMAACHQRRSWIWCRAGSS
jgi:hypothetical protein